MIRCRLSAVALGLVVSLLGSGGLTAQEKKEPQATFEPRSAPGSGQKYLEAFVGEWDVTKTFYPPTGAAVRVLGTCRQSMIHDGRFLQSEFTFDQDGKRSTGLGVVGFEPDTARFTTVWTDSRSTRFSLRQSQEPFDGNEIVLFGRSLDEGGQKATPPSSSRTVSSIDPAHNRIVHRQYVQRGEAKERLIMELEMVRRPTGASRR